jgi:hypothetical protein
MMLRCTLFLISFFFAFWVRSQDTLTLTPLNAIQCMNIDASQNIWVTDDAFTLYKFDLTGKQITNVNIKSYGTISSIDCSNPFEIYVYHRDQNILVFYDNMLNKRGEIRFNDLYIYNVACVARSFDNQIWILDISDYTLKKISKSGKLLASSIYLNTISSKALNTYKIWEEDGHTLVADSLNGILSFDLFGTYETTYSFYPCTSATSISKLFYVNQKGSLMAYNSILRNPIPLKYSLPLFAQITKSGNAIYYSVENRVIRIPIQ